MIESYIIRLMERTNQLLQIDRQICNYYQRHHASKNNSIFCYQPNKEAIASFYSTMADNFFQQKLKENSNSKQKPQKTTKAKSQILSNIRNPVRSCLPKQISQNSTIQVDRAEEQKMLKSAMFSQVQTSKKSKYAIAKEVFEMIAQDIKVMLVDKQQANFRKKFPNNHLKEGKNAQVNSAKTEELIKDYNRFLTKFKNSKGDSYHNTLGLLQQNIIQQSSIDANTSDQKFQILGIFKKIYMETKSNDISQNLIRYIKKFQLFDKLDKKLRHNSVASKKSSIIRSNSTLPHSTQDGILHKKASLKPQPEVQKQVKFDEKTFGKEKKVGNGRSLSNFAKIKHNGNIQIRKSKLKLEGKNQNTKNH